MEIQPAEPDHAEAIQSMLIRSCRDAYADILDDHTLLEALEMPSKREAIRERIEDDADNCRYLIAHSDGAVVGFAAVQWGRAAPERHPGEAYLQSLYVLPEVQSDGIGSRLLSRAIQTLPATVERVALSVIAANERGRRFYASRGFEHVDDGTYEIVGAVYTTAIYCKTIESD